MPLTICSGKVYGPIPDKPYLSVIVPVYNEEDNVLELYDRLCPVLRSLGRPYEVLFIDDGSTDGTALRLGTIRDDSVSVVRFQRNFGKAAALSCGFLKAGGEIVITMDGDLQDDPGEIPRFIDALKKYDVVSGWKYRRQDPPSKTLPSKAFNWLTRWLTGVNIHDFNCGFKAYRGCVVKNLRLYGEFHRYIPVLAFWKGFSVGEIGVKHHQRLHGKSKYGFSRLIKGFLDLITIKFLTTYVNRPLHLFGTSGLAVITAGGMICTYLLYLWAGGNRIGDRPLLMLGVLLVIIGVQFIALGLIGELMISHRDHNDWIVREEKTKDAF